MSTTKENTALMSAEKLHDFKIDLSKYGQVNYCNYVKDKVSIVIGKGFSIKATIVLDVLQRITVQFPDYPLIETLITDTDNFFLILRKSKK